MPPPPTTQESPETSIDQIDAVGKKLDELSIKPKVVESNKPLSEIHSEERPIVEAAVEAETMFEPVSPTPLPDDSKSSEEEFVEGICRIFVH